MAAYAALVSVMHLIEQIRHHPSPPISLSEKQVQSLTEKFTFLQEFLEFYSCDHNEEEDRLRSQIADAAYAAQVVIESHIVDQILAQSTNHVEEIGGSTVDFYQGLQKVIQDVDLIKKEVMEIKEKMASSLDIELHRSGSFPTSGSSRSPSKGQNIVVGLDEALVQLLDMLVGYDYSLLISQIVGMGGIGKTTLARYAYESEITVYHFDIRVWVTVSQEYSIKEIILQILSCLTYEEDKKKSCAELGESLYKRLFGRRYLIIMDDVWNIEVWDNLKMFLPNNCNGSRILITTRLSTKALPLPLAYVFEMNFLNEELSWTLLCKTVFGEDGCPLQLEKIGKKIAQNCRGLPLSIVVIGGLLAKCGKTIEYWKDIARNLNSAVNVWDGDHCFNLLSLSYDHLPVHLKSCFLYMGVFPEDAEIHVSDLVRLWVAEGFLKPIVGKNSEEIGEEYLNELVDRNLVLIVKRNNEGKMKVCQLHDLTRNVCLREAEKEKFICVKRGYTFYEFPPGINVECRIAIHVSGLEHLSKVHDLLQFPSLARTLICESPIALSLNFRLLRILITSSIYSPEDYFFSQVNLRCLVADVLDCPDSSGPSTIPSSAYLLWNLQTLIARHTKIFIEIWRFPLLRHVKFNGLLLPDYPDDEHGDIVLENLQTLSNVLNFKCSEKMVKMIPNIKKLQISYDVEFEGSRFCLNNLAYLHKLESLNLNFYSWVRPSRSDLMKNLSFPKSLKKLALEGCNLHWENNSTEIGSLPLLQVLKLKRNSLIGPIWETIEGEFPSLKYLLLENCCDLKHWITYSTHFPRLESLVLRHLTRLKEIPSCIGDIITLQSIELHNCSDSAVISAKEILLEQEELGNDDLQVRVIH